MLNLSPLVSCEFTVTVGTTKLLSKSLILTAVWFYYRIKNRMGFPQFLRIQTRVDEHSACNSFKNLFEAEWISEKSENESLRILRAIN